MTRVPRPPGTLFLRVTQLLFADETVSALFVPAIAGFQDGATGIRRPSAGLRHALPLVLGAYAASRPGAVFSAEPAMADRAASTDATTGDSLFQLLAMSLFAGEWGWLLVMAPRCGREFMMAALLGGVVLACAIRAWNNYQPAGCAISMRVAALPATPAVAVVKGGL